MTVATRRATADTLPTASQAALPPRPRGRPPKAAAAATAAASGGKVAASAGEEAVCRKRGRPCKGKPEVEDSAPVPAAAAAATAPSGVTGVQQPTAHVPEPPHLSKRTCTSAHASIPGVLSQLSPLRMRASLQEMQPQGRASPAPAQRNNASPGTFKGPAQRALMSPASPRPVLCCVPAQFGPAAPADPAAARVALLSPTKVRPSPRVEAVAGVRSPPPAAVSVVAASLPQLPRPACVAATATAKVQLDFGDAQATITMPHRKADEAAFDPASNCAVSLVQALLNGSGRQRRYDGAAPVGRVQQYDRVKSTLAHCMQEGGGAVLYLSGMPGTGKSHTVAALLAHLAANVPLGGAPPVSVHVNCMTLADPSDIYAALQRGVQAAVSAGGTPSRAAAPAASAPASAYHSLVSLLQWVHHAALSRDSSTAGRTGARGGGRVAASNSGLVVLVLDEVDRLADKAHEDLYRLFMMPHLSGLHVALVAIANSLDFTDRELPKLMCRGCQPTHVLFPAYDRTQVAGVLSLRLASLPWAQPVFDTDALEMAARNVANNSGDLRHAIKACCLAVDILAQLHQAGPEGSSAATSAAPAPRTVGVRQMAAALQRLAGSGSAAAAASTVGTLSRLPVQQQLVLLAVSKAVVAQQLAQKKKAAAAASALAGVDENLGWGAGAAGRGGPAFSGRMPPVEAGPPPRTPSTSGRVARTGGSSQSKGSAGRWQPPGSCESAGSSLLGGGWQVTAAEARVQYEALCRELLMRAVPQADFLTSARLLDASALLRVAGTRLGLRVAAKDLAAALRGNVIYRKLFPEGAGA